MKHSHIGTPPLWLFTVIILASTSSLNAAVITLNGTQGNLATDESNFYSTVGESADFTESFTGLSVGDNLATINAGVSGFSITTLTGSNTSISDGSAQGITGGDGRALLFADSGPGQSARFTFTSPVDYFSLYDHDQPGIIDITIEFVGGGTQFFDINDTTGGNGITFIGVFRNDDPNQIESFLFSHTGETDGMLIDNLQWGVIPEPSSNILIGLSGIALVLRRRC